VELGQEVEGAEKVRSRARLVECRSHNAATGNERIQANEGNEWVRAGRRCLRLVVVVVVGTALSVAFTGSTYDDWSTQHGSHWPHIGQGTIAAIITKCKSWRVSFLAPYKFEVESSKCCIFKRNTLHNSWIYGISPIFYAPIWYTDVNVNLFTTKYTTAHSIHCTIKIGY